MSKALSLDLRVRVLGGGGGRRNASRGGGTVWGERGEREPLAHTGTRTGRSATQGDRRRPSLETHRGVHAAVIAALETEPGHHHRGGSRRASPSRVWSSASARYDASSPATPSRAKKDGARQRAGPPGRPEAAAGLVRRPARSRSGAPGLHRRDLGQDQDGAAPRPLPARPAAAGRACRTATGRRRPSSPA